MKKELTAKIIQRMKREVTNWRFLINNQLEKSVLIESFSMRPFYETMLSKIEKDDFSCAGAAECYMTITDTLFGIELKENFLKLTYQYVLNKSFPDAVTEEFDCYPSNLYEVFLVMLSVINDHQTHSDDQSFMSIYPMSLLTEEEVRSLDDPEEYNKFSTAYKEQHIYTMMKLNYEVTGHSTIEHILGVHYLALSLGRQVLNQGVPVDLGRVSGAAAGHDIGKFGCHPDEIKKIAYYHYYYTYNWFTRLDISYIKNVAVYHSTWDLELESLSIESLILIYSDFCVKRSKTKEGLFKMKFLSVDEAFDVILSKLDNVDEYKRKRYERVYQKLKNFSEYLEHLGVCVTVENYKGQPLKKQKPLALTKVMSSTLSTGPEIVENLKHFAIDKSVRLMHRLRHASSLNAIIQEAVGEKDVQMLRRYIFIFEEYSTYLTPSQKMITLTFLMRYLMHSEEDIRKESSTLIGTLLAFYDENYTKELPERANVAYTVETKFNMLNDMLSEFLFNETRMTDVKKERQLISYYEILKSLYHQVDDAFKNMVTELLMSYYVVDLSRFSSRFMINVVTIIPLASYSDEDINTIVSFLIAQLDKDEDLRLQAISELRRLLNSDRSEDFAACIKQHRNQMNAYQNMSKSIAELYLSKSIEALFDREYRIDIDGASSDMFLSNLKSATSKIAKEAQIEMLFVRSMNSGHEDKFYTAMHFCNLLKVSAYETVRNKAGNCLIKVFDKLSPEHKNDIVIELVRALEIEGYGFTRYIPNFLGQLIPKLNEREYKEISEDIHYKMSNAGIHVRVLLLDTLTAMIRKWLLSSNYVEIKTLLGYIFRGFYSGNKLMTQIAFNVLSKNLLGNDEIPLKQRFELFKLTSKKLNSFIMDIHKFTSLDLLNYSVGMHYIYHFITDYIYFEGEMIFDHVDKVAFYSGTFDPFSLGQKAAAIDAASLDMEVYISISEFQWRRRTQPSLMRRQIVEMSIADQFDLHTFPQEIPINLRRNVDLKALKNLFIDQEVYIVVGEEALLHDALYKKETSDIYGFSHIVYKRESINHTTSDLEIIEERLAYITGEVIIRTLEYKYEMIDVDQIRRNIDNNWDAYDVIDDLATKFIVDRNLYKNEPQFKSTVPINELEIEVQPLSRYTGLANLCDKFDIEPEHIKHLALGTYAGDLDLELVLKRQLLTIRDKKNDEIIAFSIYSKASPKHLFDEIKSLEILEEIATKKYQKILIIDYIYMKHLDKVHALDQIIVTETLMTEIRNGYEYAVIKCIDINELSENIHGVILRSGFLERKCTYSNKVIFSVDMSSPVVLNLDGTTRMKTDFRSNDQIRDTIKLVRSNLQQAIVDLYPGSLVLSFDRSMLYNHLIRQITTRNEVPIKESKELGELICVPYGDIFKRWLLPNTMTKAFHTERYYTPELKAYEVKSYPGYLSIENQTKVLKSYNRPVILVDDIVDKGNRLTAIEGYLKSADIEINHVIVGILSKRGKEYFESKGMSMSAAYYIPKIKVWFNESDVYPFIGGDSLVREERDNPYALISTNLMLPFSYPTYIKSVGKMALYKLSEVCLENALMIMEEIEKVYLDLYKRNLSIGSLREVMITPRIPDIGLHINYDMYQKPSVFINNELERLGKMKHAFKDTI